MIYYHVTNNPGLLMPTWYVNLCKQCIATTNGEKIFMDGTVQHFTGQENKEMISAVKEL